MAVLGTGATGIVFGVGSPLVMDEESADPASIANAGQIYTKDVAGTTELFYEDDTGAVSQLTTAGSGAHIVNDATTDAVSVAVVIRHTTTGTPAAGIGVGVSLQAEDSAGGNAVAARLDGVLTTVTDGSEVGAFDINALDVGTLRRVWRMAPTAQTMTQAVATAGSPVALTITGGAHTTLATATEAMDVLFDIGRTVQFASGNFATQRAVSIEAPTYAATAATTITNAATLHIGGQPVAGTSMTLSNPYALWIESQNNAIRLTNATDAFEMRVGCAFINFLESASSVAEISVDTNDNLFVWQKVTNRQLFIRSDLSNAASAAIQFRTNGANNRWAFRTEGHFVPSSDNTYDIGDDDANSGVRNIYFASATYLGGSAGGIGITQPAISGGTRSVLTVTGGAHTALATTVEAIDVLFDIARTVQWAQGNITTQRAVQIEAPTWATATSASTFANGVNVAIDSAPNAGTNCVFTALSALRVGSADVTVGATSSGLNYATIRVPAHTATVDGTTQVTASPGIAALSLGIISINDTDNDAVTIDTGATLYIAGAPAITGGSTITLTSAYSLWVDAGDVRFDGDVRLGTAGSTTDPNVVLDADTDTGVSLAGGNEMYFITGGGRRAECTGQGLGWASGSAASPGLYALSSSGTGLYLVTTNIIGMVTGGVEGTRWNPHSIASAADATADIFSVPAQTVTVTGATGITTATGFNLSNIGIPTMSAESALTIDYSASLYISGPPTGGGAGPATITNRYALWVDSGKVRFDGAGTSSQVTAEGGVLALLASTVNGNNASSTIAIGAAVSIGVTTYTNDTATLTMTNVASLYIAGIPVASTNVTFTNPAYSLWIDAGLPRIDSTTANGTVATAMSNVGPVGSNTTIQEWLTINIGGTTRYIPCF